MFYAHSVAEQPKAVWQRLADHLENVAALAADFAAPLCLAHAARLAGLLHDLGKYSDAFQRRLDDASVRADHSTAGAWLVLQRAKAAPAVERMMAELIAYAILGHHVGLPDRIGAGGLAERIASFNATTGLRPDWAEDICLDAEPLAPMLPARPGGQPGFRCSLLGRMLFSCLVDADFRDTEAFYARSEGTTPDRDWPALAALLPDLIARFDAHMAGKTRRDTPVNALRAEILTHVRAKAALPPGLFTLTVPTGGGKTLASLGFALDHAARHGHRRILYAIPFTSIIEQTAAIFRDVLGDGVVLEHHASLDDDHFERQGARDKVRLAIEDWAAPVVVTTNAQFFDSLFAARPGRARKLHNIAGSVILLDEAQMLPRPLMIPCVQMLDELARSYGCSIVLCTATQPALDARDLRENHPLALTLDGRELAPDPAHLARALSRVRVCRVGELGNDDLVAALGETPQGLVIVNSRAHARDLYKAVTAADLDGAIHLSTRHYAADRCRILDDARARLRQGRPCRVIATSLVEAGVDVDFPRVWRAEAGLDQIAQAAGRCNREGKRAAADSVVTVFRAPDYPMPKEIRDLVGDLDRLGDRFDADLLSPEAMRAFLGEMFWRMDEKGLDRNGIMERFRLNGAETNFAYRTVAEKFQLIVTDMRPVIVAREAGAQEAVRRLDVAALSSGGLARALQAYMVQVPRPAFERLRACGHVRYAAPEVRGDQFAVLQTPSLYTPDAGLIWEDGEYLSLEQSIF